MPEAQRVRERWRRTLTRLPHTETLHQRRERALVSSTNIHEQLGLAHSFTAVRSAISLAADAAISDDTTSHSAPACSRVS